MSPPQIALLTPDELKSMPKGQFVVSKTGCYPMQSTLNRGQTSNLYKV